MRLEVRFSTTYSYEPPAAGGLTVVRLRPRSGPGQVVESSVVDVSTGVVSLSYVDGWGNHADVIEFVRPHDSARYTMRAVVRTEPGVLPLTAGLDELDVYRKDSARVRAADVAPLGWHVADEGRSWAAIESALAWIPQRNSYRTGVTDTVNPLDRVVASGAGACHDLAHVLLAIIRGWGWSARYVSGYVFTGSGDDVIEAAAMHAWVEVWRPGAGWAGMDPTTGRLAGERYIAVGYGRDYEDVRPVRGVLHGQVVLQDEPPRLRIGVAAELHATQRQSQAGSGAEC